VIHVELPWNPNRLEQRNGRVDRYGQTRQPEIRYLFYPDSPEDFVLDALVRKIEQMQGDRVSTPDILGVLSGTEVLEQGLVTLDGEATNREEAASRLVRLFEDRTVEFIRTVQPLVLGGRDARAEIEAAERTLQSAEPLLTDDLELERFLTDILGVGRFSSTGEDGIFQVMVPRAFQGVGVQPIYLRATCRRSVAVHTQPAGVEFLTPLHPLLRAIADDARRRFLQVYADDRGLPAKRLAARRIPAGEVPSILFTFFGTVEDVGGLVQETVIPVRCGLDGKLTSDDEDDRRLLLDAGSVGEVPATVLGSIFGARFGDSYAAAQVEAARRLAALVDTIRARHSHDAQLLRDDMLRYADDRRRELDEEERFVTGREDRQSGQQFLWAAQPKTGFDARRAAVDTFVNRRQEEIEAFVTIHAPAPPRPLGAVLLVPEGMEAAP
jgi:hypothetical protein